MPSEGHSWHDDGRLLVGKKQSGRWCAPAEGRPRVGAAFQPSSAKVSAMFSDMRRVAV